MAITKQKLIRLVNDNKKVVAVTGTGPDGVRWIEYFATNRQSLTCVNREALRGCYDARGKTVWAWEVPVSECDLRCPE